MFKLLKIKLYFLVLFFFFSFFDIINANDQKIVNEINIVGNMRVDDETILSFISISKDSNFNNQSSNKIIKELYATGFFSDVSVVVNDSKFLITVNENSIINKIGFEGNKRFDDELLLKLVEIKKNQIFTKNLIANSVNKIVQIYKSQGRFGTVIIPRFVELEGKRVDLVFEINEGPLYTVKSISFTGNKIFSDRRLKEVISTKQTAWWRFITSSDNYDSERLEIDASQLRQFYFTRGFVNFKILRKQGDLLPDRSGFSVVYVLFEGLRHSISSIKINSDLENLPTEQMRKLIPIVNGEWYNLKKLEKGISNINKNIADLGYAFAEIRPDFKINPDDLTIELTLNVIEGSKNYIELIEITGNSRTLDSVIRREIELVEGDPFNNLKLKNSEKKIRNLGYFKKVVIKPYPGSKTNQAKLNVDVEEQATGDISLGIAYSTFDELSTTFGISEKNFLGRGQRAKFNFSLSEKRQNFAAGVTQPYFLNRNLIGSFDIFSQTYTNSASDQRTKSAGFTSGAGFSSANDFSHNFSYSLQNIETQSLDSNDNLISTDGGKVLSSLGYTLGRDTRDNRFSPSSGYNYTVSEQYAGIGGDINYLRSVIGAGYYYKYDYTDIVLGFTGQYGNIEGLGENVVQSSRFYLGGRKVRGFDASGIGPRSGLSSGSSSVGGNNYYAASMAIRSGIGLPKETGLQWTVFTDFGSLWGVDDASSSYAVSTNKNSMRISMGYGFQWDTPIGPLTFTWADAIKKESFDQLRRFEFRLGSTF